MVSLKVQCEQIVQELESTLSEQLQKAEEMLATQDKDFSREIAVLKVLKCPSRTDR